MSASYRLGSAKKDLSLPNAQNYSNRDQYNDTILEKSTIFFASFVSLVESNAPSYKVIKTDNTSNFTLIREQAA